MARGVGEQIGHERRCASLASYGTAVGRKVVLSECLIIHSHNTVSLPLFHHSRLGGRAELTFEFLICDIAMN